MKIELGTYYVGDTPEHSWQCQHCANFTFTPYYPNRGECVNIGIHRCEQRACPNLEISEAARELMAKIILSLQSIMISRGRDED